MKHYVQNITPSTARKKKLYVEKENWKQQYYLLKSKFDNLLNEKRDLEEKCSALEEELQQT